MSRRSTTPATALAALALIASLPLAAADTCYYFGRPYECDRGGLSTGARWGIGAGIAFGVVALIMLMSYWRRKRIMNAWKKHTQNNGETLPYANNGYQNDNNANGYYNNTQYPTTYGNQTTEYAPPAGAPPIKQPQAAYNPSTAGAYGQNGGTYSYGQNNTSNDNDGAHDYEYRQAEENRLAEEAEARRAAGGNEPAPPGYDAQPTGAAGQGSYQAPAGPPPGKGAREGAGIV